NDRDLPTAARGYGRPRTHIDDLRIVRHASEPGQALGNYLGLRPGCGARHKSDGRPCGAIAMKSERCHLHGGKSTGPRPPEGLAGSRGASLTLPLLYYTDCFDAPTSLLPYLLATGIAHAPLRMPPT